MSNEIKIPFRDDMVKACLHEGKRCTTRYKKYGETGDRFLVGSRWFVITNVARVRLKKVMERYYLAEGFSTMGEFVDVWTQIHPKRGFRMEDMVWVHFFKEADDER